jgi:hypothetical protein
MSLQVEEQEPDGKETMDDASVIMGTEAYVWANGATMVFDQHGEQMEGYQGMWDEVRDRILADKPPTAMLHMKLGWELVRLGLERSPDMDRRPLSGSTVCTHTPAASTDSDICEDTDDETVG